MASIAKSSIINIRNTITFPRSGRESSSVRTSIFIPFTELIERRGRRMRRVRRADILTDPGTKEMTLLYFIYIYLNRYNIFY